MDASNETVHKTINKKKLIHFLISFIVAIFMAFILKEPGFTDSQVYVIFLLIFSLGLWITEAIPAFAVSIFIMSFLVFALGNEHLNSAPESIDKYVNTFSSSVIWLMLGGLLLSSAMKKIKLDEALFRFTVRLSGSKPRNLLIGLMTITMLTAMLMSSTAATAMVIAAITPLIASLGKQSGVTKALLLGVPTAAAIGAMGTIIGTPSNAVAVGALENIGVKVSFLDWMIFGAPLAVMLTAASCVVLMLFLLKDNSPIPLDLIESKPVEMTPEMKRTRRIVIPVIIITILLWLTGSFFGIKVASVTAVPFVIFTLTGVITAKDVQSLPWDTLLLVAGGLSLGIALQETNLLSYYAGKIVGMGLGPMAILSVLAFLAMLFSNFMSDTAISTILIPLGLALLPGLQKDTALIIALASSAAVLLPVSKVPNAIAYSTGFLEQKDFRICGLLVGLLGPILIILWVMLIS